MRGVEEPPLQRGDALDEVGLDQVASDIALPGLAEHLRRGRRLPRLLYANADLAKATQNNKVLTFAEHWKTVTGKDPALLVMDSKVTTQTQLGELTARGIGFITLRARTPKLTAHLHAQPASAWTPMTIARAGGKAHRVRVIEDTAARLSTYPGTLRQLAVAGLGRASSASRSANATTAFTTIPKSSGNPVLSGPSPVQYAV